MSDFGEELTKLAVAEDGKRETSVFSNPGMHFPWLQNRVETVVTGGKRKRDFTQTTSACLSFIHEALLKHQWQRAAEYMHSYLQTLEDSDPYKRQAAPEIIWKLGSEILFYHPRSNVETFNSFADRMKNIGVLNYLKISLQHALYLLHHGMLEDANRNLSDAETWRYGEKSSSQEVLINLVQAYKGLLQYYTWSKKKTELSELDEDDYAYTAKTQNMLSQSCKTSANIGALLKTPGVWDPFVKSYVEMLEFYGDQDGAREILTNYAYDEKFPSNPNAHIYLYEFLKREKAPRAKLISVLKILHEIVPSHPLMLEFHMLLRKSETEEHRKLGLAVLFEVLDFAGCTKNITAWKYLAKYLKQTLMESHLAWVEEEWKSRRSWWPAFHFSCFWAKSDWKADTGLACEKAFVAGILLGKDCRYFRYILKQGRETLKKKIKWMKKSVKKYSIVNPDVCT
ncbi:TATA box-binding protein-associated factor RNA polymerase I subunit A isoform X1 [Peromyscus eremicus]|uniref:TATA box-binding protein-associated factor RNA polymerase I subunit A isoform X1 n=1 Tax=Peromyscus eremicus TaxID=42410 RepID=UPI0027DC7C84|nr:TATA box-binding protein-associated factor RNA polymerase I subunit A isoform X1 [Peromyscus eremicus]